MSEVARRNEANTEGASTSFHALRAHVLRETLFFRYGEPFDPPCIILHSTCESRLMSCGFVEAYGGGRGRHASPKILSQQVSRRRVISFVGGPLPRLGLARTLRNKILRTPVGSLTFSSVHRHRFPPSIAPSPKD